MTACDDRAPTSLDRSISPVTATSAAALKRPSRTASSHHFAPAVTNARAGNSPRGRPGHSRLSGASEPPSSPPPISRRVSRLEHQGLTSCAETARDCRLRAMPLVLAAESEWPCTTICIVRR